MVVKFRTIKPGKPFQSSIFRDEMEKEMRAIAKDMQSDFEQTVKNWKHQVKFKTKITIVGKKRIIIDISTDDEVYRFVDEGTKPHLIRPKHRGYPLKFQTGGEPKTQPNVILSTRGKTGTNTVRAMVVHHPGTEARNFSKLIAKSYNKEFRQRIQNAIDRANRRTGYAITKR